jgi:putative SOS response-associated peptidase YedK
MCYYNGQQVTQAEYIQLKELEKEIRNISISQSLQNGFDYGEGYILKPNAHKDHFELVKAHWEFIPFWCRSMKEVEENRKKFTTLNAAGEKLLESKMYREAALKRRCLVLSSGFYEWRHYRKASYPYFIKLKGREYFFMAGIYQPWTDKETGETFDTYAIVTTKANALMEQIHNTKKRMPVILPEDLAFEWMFGKLDEKRLQELASYQLDPDCMQAYTIRKDFRMALDPLEAFDYELLPAL